MGGPVTRFHELLAAQGSVKLYHHQMAVPMRDSVGVGLAEGNGMWVSAYKEVQLQCHTCKWCVRQLHWFNTPARTFIKSDSTCGNLCTTDDCAASLCPKSWARDNICNRGKCNRTVDNYDL